MSIGMVYGLSHHGRVYTILWIQKYPLGGASDVFSGRPAGHRILCCPSDGFPASTQVSSLIKGGTSEAHTE